MNPILEVLGKTTTEFTHERQARIDEESEEVFGLRLSDLLPKVSDSVDKIVEEACVGHSPFVRETGTSLTLALKSVLLLESIVDLLPKVVEEYCGRILAPGSSGDLELVVRIVQYMHILYGNINNNIDLSGAMIRDRFLEAIPPEQAEALRTASNSPLPPRNFH